MKFVCANADLIQDINLDTDYDYITAKAKSHVLAIETLANSFAKSKSNCVLFVWDTDDPNDLVRATEQASLENINFKEVIDELKHYIDFSVLGDFDFKTFELENGMTISIVKYVTMNNLRESKKSIKENKHDFSVYDFIDYMIKMKCIDGIMDNINFSITQEDFNYALNDLGYDFKIIKKENPHDSIDGVKYYIYQYQIDDEIYRVWIDEKWFVLDACLKY